jgi:N-acetylmuramoyl-L-alanine amidase
MCGNSQNPQGDSPSMDRRQLLGLLLAGASATLAPTGAFAQKAPRRSGPAVLVLDPGHGGHDPGAIGVSGTYEKEITLAVGLGIRQALSGHRDLKVVLTRARDEFLPLDDRVEVAHEADADLFVSIHADAAPTLAARGLSAYTRSDKASDSFAGALAKRENMVDTLYGFDLKRTDRATAAILMDLAKRHSRNASLAAKKRIVSGVKGKVLLLENPMRSANFAVLRSTTIPSVLVETGFLSNPKDEAMLSNARSRAAVVRALAEQLAPIVLELQSA